MKMKALTNNILSVSPNASILCMKTLERNIVRRTQSKLQAKLLQGTACVTHAPYTSTTLKPLLHWLSQYEAKDTYIFIECIANWPRAE